MDLSNLFISQSVRDNQNMNKNYIKGRNKEYHTKYKLEKQGYDIVQRTAGSHSPFDLIAIRKDIKLIKFIQCKPKSMSEENKKKIEKENYFLNDIFNTEFEVL